MADPDYTIIDGFDKYFQTDNQWWVNASSGLPAAAIDWRNAYNGEWSVPAPGNAIYSREPIGTTRGFSLGVGGSVDRSLPTTYARVVGGICMKLSSTSSPGMQVQLGLGGTTLTLQWNVDGNFYARRGTGSSTIFATGVGPMFPLTLNSTHFISWDVEQKSTGGRVKVWIDGTLVIDFTGDTTSGSDGTNYIALYSYNSGNQFDHFYMDCYLTGGGSELPFLTNPVVYTDNPESDSAANFTIGTTMLGDVDTYNWTTTGSATNTTRMRRVQANASGNLNSLYFMPWATSGAAKIKGALYADSAGVPAGLIATTNEVTGLTAQVPVQLTFGSPPALTAGTWYWIAFRTDTNVNFLTRRGTGAGGLAYTATYANAFLNPASGLSAAAEVVSWGVMSGQTSRADTLDVLNPSVSFAFNSSGTPGQEDLFNPPAVPGTPTGVHHVSVKAFGYRTDAGARTVDLRIKSGASTYSGSYAGQTPNALTPSWMTTDFRKDPNGNIAWTKANLDASKFGYKLVT